MHMISYIMLPIHHAAHIHHASCCSYIMLSFIMMLPVIAFIIMLPMLICRQLSHVCLLFIAAPLSLLSQLLWWWLVRAPQTAVAVLKHWSEQPLVSATFLDVIVLKIKALQNCPRYPLLWWYGLRPTTQPGYSLTAHVSNKSPLLIAVKHHKYHSYATRWSFPCCYIYTSMNYSLGQYASRRLCYNHRFIILWPRLLTVFMNCM